jgi:hypothetical protein
MQVVVVMMAQRFRLSLAAGRAVDVDPGLTLRTRSGVPLILHPADGRFRSVRGGLGPHQRAGGFADEATQNGRH